VLKWHLADIDGVGRVSDRVVLVLVLVLVSGEIGDFSLEFSEKKRRCLAMNHFYFGGVGKS
jgi:hypothetical protein